MSKLYVSNIMYIHMAYNRKIRLYDEPHSPVAIDAMIKNKKMNKGKFLNPNHSSSYMIQMRLIHTLPGTTVLEIGPGENFCGRNLESIGYTYHTVDIDNTYNPTYLGDFRNLTIENQYPIVAAFQILEHVPYKDSFELIKKMSSICTGHIVISVPYSCKGRLTKDITMNGQKSKSVKRTENFSPTGLPNRKVRKEFLEEFPYAHHYWELGRGGLTKEKYFSDIEALNLKIVRTLHADNPYHYFIVIKKL